MNGSGDGDPSGAASRRLAALVVREVDAGARTNVVLHRELARAELDERDRAFVTELSHGATRMRRACDHLIDRHVNRPPDPTVRALLRIGTHQLVFLGTPPHAAVSATVAAAPPRVRGFVNAVLRRIASDVERGGRWPTLGVELSYPDWFIDAAIDELGEDDAVAALEAMNQPEAPPTRADGYAQGAASQAVVDEVDVAAGECVVDLCAAPGGKATALAAKGAAVVALDLDARRVAELGVNAARYGHGRTSVVRGDARRPPVRAGSVDHVLVDAPCSGWGVLGRRSDARWRITPDDVTRLAGVQVAILDAAAALVAPGGTLVYSVCTFSRAETVGVATSFDERHGPDFAPARLLHPDRWRTHGDGGLLLPQDRRSDAMAVFRWRRRPDSGSGPVDPAMP